MLVRTVECLEGHVEIELVCEPAFDYGREPAEWTHRRTGTATPPMRAEPGQTFRLKSDLAARHRGRPRPRPPRPSRGETAPTAPSPGPRSSRRRRTSSEAEAQDRRDDPLLAGLAQHRPDSGSPPARSDPALGAGDQGPDLPADRRHRRRAHDLATRDAWRGAQLGLSLYVDPRHDLHSAGAPLPQPQLGSRRVHGVRRGPRADRGRFAADHVWHRRPARPDRVDAGRPDRLRRAPGPSGSETERSTSARTTSSAPSSTRSCCTRGTASASLAASGRSCSRRPSAPSASGESLTRASGRPAASHSTTSPQSSCAGSRSTARPSSPRSAATPSCETKWRGVADEIHADILEHGVQGRGSPPALRD